MRSRLLLLVAMVLSMVSGFVLPVGVARLNNCSDNVFLFLALFNPLIMLLSFDQRKVLLIKKYVDYNYDTSLRLVSTSVLMLIGGVYAVVNNQFYLLPIIAIKTVTFYLEFLTAIYQRFENNTRTVKLRVLEVLLILSFAFFNRQIFVTVLIAVVCLICFYFNKEHTIFKLNLTLIKERFWPGLQSASTSFLSSIPVYILSMNELGISVTEYSVQVAVFSGFYMLSSMHYAIYSDKVRDSSFHNALRYTINVAITYLLILAIGTCFIYSFNIISQIFNVNIGFTVFSFYGLALVVLNSMKNYMYTLSYKTTLPGVFAKIRVSALALALLILVFSSFAGSLSFVFLLLVHVIEVLINLFLTYDFHRKL